MSERIDRDALIEAIKRECVTTTQWATLALDAVLPLIADALDKQGNTVTPVTQYRSDLAEWLLARFAEDERDAHRAGGRRWGSINRSWDAEPQRDIAALGDGPTQRLFTVPDGYDEHVARWSPARVLRECEAKRQIVENAAHAVEHQDIYAAMLAYYVLRTLALPYADHEGYRQEWRP
jgi:hypothetical protein